MVRRTFAVLSTFALLLAGVALIVPNSDISAAGRKSKKPLTKLQHDPNAEEVELFQGIEDGQLTVKLIQKDPFTGNVLIENTTDKPLTVKLPEAVVGVPKHLAQFGAGGFGGQGGGGFGGGGLGGQQGGGQQQTGGGFGGGGLGGGGLGGGGGFFGGGGGGFGSIPPEAVASIPLNTVCLQHGKPDPTSRTDYVLVPVDQYTDDPALRELLKVVGSGKVDKQAAQAAAWHLTDKMSLAELANKSVQHVGGLPPTPYFSAAQLAGADALLRQIYEATKDLPRPEKNPPRETIRSGRVESAAK